MANPTKIQGGTGSAASASSASVVFGSPVSDTNTLVVCMYLHANTTITATGWKLLGRYHQTNSTMAVLIREADTGAGDSTSFTFNFGTAGKSDWVYYEWSNTSPFETISIINGATVNGSANFTSPTAVSVVANQQAIVFFGYNSSTVTSSAATGWTQDQNLADATNGQTVTSYLKTALTNSGDSVSMSETLSGTAVGETITLLISPLPVNAGPYITQQQVLSVADGSAGTSNSQTFPGFSQAPRSGRLLIAFIYNNYNASSGGFTGMSGSPPAGWSTYYGQSQGGTSDPSYTGIYSVVAGGGETGADTFSMSVTGGSVTGFGWSAVMVEVANSGNIDTVNDIVIPSSNTTSVSLSATPSSFPALPLAFIFRDSTAAVGGSTPSNWLSLVTQHNANFASTQFFNQLSDASSGSVSFTSTTNTLNTYSGSALIFATPPGTQATQTTNASADIQASTTKTATALADISAPSTKTSTASADISASSTKTSLASADVKQTSVSTANAHADIQSVSSQTSLASADIMASSTLTSDASAYIAVLGTSTVDASADIAQSSTITAGASADISTSSSQTSDASADILAQDTLSSDASADIQTAGTQTADATAVIAAGSFTGTLTSDASADITAQNQETATASADIVTSTFSSSTASADILAQSSISITAKADVAAGSTKTTSASADVRAQATTSTTASADILTQGTHSAQASADLSAFGITTISAHADVRASSTEVSTASADIASLGTLLSEAIADILASSTLTTEAKAVIASPPDPGTGAGIQSPQIGRAFGNRGKSVFLDMPIRNSTTLVLPIRRRGIRSGLPNG